MERSVKGPSYGTARKKLNDHGLGLRLQIKIIPAYNGALVSQMELKSRLSFFCRSRMRFNGAFYIFFCKYLSGLLPTIPMFRRAWIRSPKSEWETMRREGSFVSTHSRYRDNTVDHY